MKKVLLLNPPYIRPIMRDTFHPTSKSLLYIWHPLDILIQSGRLCDFDLRIHDGVVNNGMEPLDRLLREFKPDAVLSLVAYPTLKSDMELLESIKKTYGSTIFAVGAPSSMKPRCMAGITKRLRSVRLPSCSGENSTSRSGAFMRFAPDLRLRREASTRG